MGALVSDGPEFVLEPLPLDRRRRREAAATTPEAARETVPDVVPDATADACGTVYSRSWTRISLTTMPTGKTSA